jgi:ribosomal protein S15P/S13E
MQKELANINHPIDIDFISMRKQIQARKNHEFNNKKNFNEKKCLQEMDQKRGRILVLAQKCKILHSL